MSICDLGQALFNAPVLLETLAEEERQQRSFLESVLLFFTARRRLSYSDSRIPAAVSAG